MGVHDGFRYSPAFAEANAAGMVWDDETLTAYLMDPRGFIPGNRMAFRGLRSEEDAAAIIAYMRAEAATTNEELARNDRRAGPCGFGGGVPPPSLAEGDAAQGERLYRPCAACHMIGEGAVQPCRPPISTGSSGAPSGPWRATSFPTSLPRPGPRGGSGTQARGPVSCRAA